MYRSVFTRLSGMAGMVGSVLVFVGMVSMGALADKTYAYRSGFDVPDLVASLAYLIGVVLLIVGTLGLFRTYARATGGLGQFGMLIMLIGLVGMLLGAASILGDMTGWYPFHWWNVHAIGLWLFGTALGTALLTLAGLRHGATPTVASKLAAVASLGFLIMVPLIVPLTVVAPDWNSGAVGIVLHTLVAIILSAFMAGLFLLGYTLWSGRWTTMGHTDPLIV